MADEIADRVREAIYAGVYAPGAPLRDVLEELVVRRLIRLGISDD